MKRGPWITSPLVFGQPFGSCWRAADPPPKISMCRRRSARFRFRVYRVVSTYCSKIVELLAILHLRHLRATHYSLVSMLFSKRTNQMDVPGHDAFATTPRFSSLMAFLSLFIRIFASRRVDDRRIFPVNSWNPARAGMPSHFSQSPGRFLCVSF